MKSEITISHIQGTNFVKKWQSNGFYPVDKIELIENEIHVFSIFYDNGIMYFKERLTYSVNDYLYILNHNEMKITNNLDEKTYID